MRLEVQVATQSDPLNIRKGPSTSNGTNGSLPKGSVVTVNGVSGDWYKLEDGRGWIFKNYTKVLKNLEEQKPPAPAPTPAPAMPEDASTGTSLGLDSKVIQMLYDQSKKGYDKRIDASTRLFGSPFQFTKQTDFRLNEEMDLGRKYLESIVAESPIVYFIPGRPNYLPDLSDSEQKAMTSFFTSKSNDSDTKSVLDKILGNKDIRYFDFIPDYAEFIKYVNILCRMCAIYIGLADETGPNGTTAYKYYDWGDYKYKNDYKQKNEKNSSVFSPKEMTADLYEAMFGQYQYTQFFVEPNTSFSESTNNNTTTSKLEGMFDSAEGIIKEVAFLTNTAAVKGLDDMRESFAKGMDDIAQKMLKNSKENFFTRLLGMSSTVLSGSNIIFPELWGDSAYNKSYNVTINLVSPYGDKESIYLNILVPMMHILALSLPRQSTANSYASPFLVKVFSKGWFSCELGIIDSINIDKGGDGSWTADGLPSEVKITVGVKDLYSNLMMTSSTKPDLFFQNQGLIDFLAVTCGVDITKPNFMLKLETMFAVFFGQMVDLPGNYFRQFIQDIRGKVEPIFKI